MPTITVKDISDHAYEKLKQVKQVKQVATINHLSINSEIICLIEKATLSKPFLPEQHLVSDRRFREKTAKFLLTNNLLQAAKQEGHT